MLWTQGHMQAGPGRPLLLSPQAVALALPSCTHAPIFVTHPHEHRHPHTHKRVDRQTSTFRHQLCGQMHIGSCTWWAQLAHMGVLIYIHV